MTLKNTLLLLLFFVSSIGTAQDLNNEDRKIKLRGIAEIGYVGVLAHKIQLSNNGTLINYVDQGGQNVLFPFSRYTLELDLNAKNTLTFLYQPLRIETTELLDTDLVIDNETFTAGSGVRFLYNFPFYRLSYLREFLPENNKYKFAFGFTAQIRNATISFESLDGSKYRRNATVGFVPALKVKSTMNFTDHFYGQIEADGIYAPVSYLNGSNDEIVGAILDASLRLGYKISKPVSAYANLRYIGGGSVGTNPDDDGPGDGFVENWLNFLSVSAGFVYEFN